MDELLEALEKCKDMAVIVEGKNDRKALEQFGFSNITELDKPLYRVVEDFQGSEVIILTDLDKKGKELYGKLARDFSKRGVRVSNELRDLLFKTKLRQIEGLVSYVNKQNF